LNKRRLDTVGFVLFLGFLLFDGFFFTHALNSQGERSLRILQKTLAGVLKHAHRLNDDLTLQSAIQSVAKSPDVLIACVVDREGKILAHSDASKIGSDFKRNHLEVPVSSYPLGEETRWGTLLLGLSDRTEHQWAARHLEILISFGVVCIGCLFWVWVQWGRARGRLVQRADDADALCRIKEEELQKILGHKKQTEELLGNWLQQAVERIPHPLLLLDGHPRIRAINRPGRDRLNAGEKPLLGESWQEVATLESCASALEHSLENHKKPFRFQLGDMELEFLSEMVNGTPGTWVSWVGFPPSNS
jgi:PAS domain-containing protein